jgi:hypothetical protein
METDPPIASKSLEEVAPLYQRLNGKGGMQQAVDQSRAEAKDCKKRRFNRTGVGSGLEDTVERRRCESAKGQRYNTLPRQL